MITFPSSSSIDFNNKTPLNTPLNDKADKNANNNFSSDQNFKDLYIDGDGICTPQNQHLRRIRPVHLPLILYSKVVNSYRDSQLNY